MTDARADARLTGWIWIAAIWCAAALFDASQTLLTMHLVSAGKAWLRPFLIVFISWLPWALATPFVIGLARRWPIVRGEIFKAMSLHLAAFVAISVTAEGWSAWFVHMFTVSALSLRFAQPLRHLFVLRCMACPPL